MSCDSNRLLRQLNDRKRLLLCAQFHFLCIQKTCFKQVLSREGSGLMSAANDKIANKIGVDTVLEVLLPFGLLFSRLCHLHNDPAELV